MHDLLALLAIALCAVIAGADGWDGMAAFGRAKEVWFRRFLRLPNGTPCADTLRRVFARLDPDAFGRCFTAWMQALVGSTEGKLVALARSVGASGAWTPSAASRHATGGRGCARRAPGRRPAGAVRVGVLG